MVRTLYACSWGFSCYGVRMLSRVAKNPIKIAPKMAPKSHGTHSRRGGTGRFHLDPNCVGFTPFLPWLRLSIHGVGSFLLMRLVFLRVTKNPIKIAPKTAPKSHGTHSRRGGSRRFRLDPNPVRFTPFLPWLGQSIYGFGDSLLIELRMS